MCNSAGKKSAGLRGWIRTEWRYQRGVGKRQTLNYTVWPTCESRYENTIKINAFSLKRGSMFCAHVHELKFNLYLYLSCSNTLSHHSPLKYRLTKYRIAFWVQLLHLFIPISLFEIFKNHLKWERKKLFQRRK